MIMINDVSLSNLIKTKIEDIFFLINYSLLVNICIDNLYIIHLNKLKSKEISVYIHVKS